MLAHGTQTHPENVYTQRLAFCSLRATQQRSPDKWLLTCAAWSPLLHRLSLLSMSDCSPPFQSSLGPAVAPGNSEQPGSPLGMAEAWENHLRSVNCGLSTGSHAWPLLKDDSTRCWVQMGMCYPRSRVVAGLFFISQFRYQGPL